MKWRTRTALPFIDGEIAAGLVLEEVPRSQLPEADRKALDRSRKLERATRKPRSIPVRWRGQVRLVSVADLEVARLLVIDTETTGLSTTAQVVEIAIVVVEADQVTDARSVLVGVPPSLLQGEEWERAAETHQIRRAEIVVAPRADRVGARLAAWYESLGRPPCCAWPTSFDARLIAQTWPSLPLYWPEDLCIKRLWSRVVGGRAPSLTNAAAALGVTPPAGQAHRALYDARLAAHLMLELRDRQQPELAPPTLPLSESAQQAEDRINAAWGTA